jgi:CheY-like chemotaxis protein
VSAVRVVDLKPQARVKRRVLVVDDDLDTVHTMATLVRLYGHEPDFAINGFAAIDVARRFRPDMIVLDMNLPDMKGYALVRQLRFEPGLEDVRMIACSGDGSDEMRQRARESGFHHFLVKPITPLQLEELLAGEPR